MIDNFAYYPEKANIVMAGRFYDFLIPVIKDKYKEDKVLGRF